MVTALGAAQAWQGVLIRAQVNGRLLAVPVAEGSEVKKGQIVAEIDPAPYRAGPDAGAGRPAARSGPAGTGQDRPEALSAAGQPGLHRQAAGRHPAALVKQVEGTVNGRSRRRRGGPGQRQLHHHQVAGGRPRGRTPGRSRQPCLHHRHHRHHHYQ
ncbi:MAG: biotin/lipoyl-binding protein [Caulobacteraceae bacterium]